MIALLICLAVSGAPAARSDRVILKEDYQVLQRDARDRASAVAVVPAGVDNDARFVVTVKEDRGDPVRREESSSIELDGTKRGVVIDGLPVGGPYTISVAVAARPKEPIRRFAHILVGDIWLLGGQSNMYGIDLVRENLPALPWLNMLNVRHIDRDAHWCAALPPIHRIPEPFAAFTLKSQHPDYTDDRIRAIIVSGQPVGGIDCSYFFARKLHAESGVPIGLIPCATGGSLSIWDPKEREKNRYGFAMHHVRSAGGRIKGMLFFQGEQDAIFGDEQKALAKPSEIGPFSSYGERFGRFIDALRADVRDPTLPVIFAQICRHHNGPDGRARAWEMVRDAQRRLPERMANTHSVPSIDLDVMDGLHLDYDSLKRMGERMARLALPYVKKGTPPRTEIRLKSVMRENSQRPALLIRFSGVSGRLRAPGRPTGFVLKTPSGKTLDWIFKVELDSARPDTLILRTTSLPGRDAALYYGAGPAPYVNITDDDDMPIPAFGPIMLDPPTEQNTKTGNAAPSPAEPAFAAITSQESTAKSKNTNAVRRRSGSHEYKLCVVTFTGRALDRNGLPVVNAVIQVVDDNPVYLGDQLLGKTRSGADGRYTLRGVSVRAFIPPPGAIPKPTESRFEVSGWAPGRAFTWHATQSYRPEPRPVHAEANGSGQVFYEGEPIVTDLVFGPTARLSGTITDDTGKPVADALVQVGVVNSAQSLERSAGSYCATIDRQKGENLPFRGVMYLPESLRSTRTDDQGKYAIEGLPRETQLLALIDYKPSYVPHSLMVATSAEQVQGARSLGYEGILNHTFVVPRTVRVHATLAGTGQPAAGVTITARGTKVQRGGSTGKTTTDGMVVLRLQPDKYMLRSEPPSGAVAVVSEQPLTVANEPSESSVDVKVAEGAVVMFETVQETTGAPIAGVAFEYETDTTRVRKPVPSQTVYVDHPVTGADGRLRVVMAPGTRRLFPVRNPGIEPVHAENLLLSLAPGKPRVVRFSFKKMAIPDGTEREAPKDDLVARLLERWKTQKNLIGRGRARVTRSVQPAEGIAPEQLIELLDSLDQSGVPPIFELIRQVFPEAEPASSLALDLTVAEPRRREQWAAPHKQIVVFNGRESVSYIPSNGQVDIADNSGKNPVAFQVQGIEYYCHLAGLNGVVTDRADGKVTLERQTTYSSACLVVDEATGFVYRDSHSFRHGNGSSQTEYWQFAPRPTPQGLVVPGMSIVFNVNDGRINHILINTIESIDLDTLIDPETFVVSVHAGTSIVDHRDGPDDMDRGDVRSPVTDIITRADEIAATWKRFVSPVKLGGQAPAIEPSVWLNQAGKIDAPKLNGKVVLLDFWGMTCGPCVGQLPEVREASKHFAGTDLIIIGLHDSSGALEQVAEFAAKRRLTYPLAIDRATAESGWFGATFAAYGVRGIPTAAVIDREGKLAFIGQFREAVELAAALLK